jgi:hypothetical protein
MVTKYFLSLCLTVVPLLSMAQLQEFYGLRKLPAGVNSLGEESLPLLSADGSRLFFARALYAGNAGGKFSGHDVWFSEASGDIWKSSSNVLPAGINDEGHNVIVGMSKDGNKIYYMSALTDEKMSGIYVTTRINNYWTRPDFVPVPGIDNQNFLGLYVSHDLDVMLFSMKAPDSRGQEDLYFSVKTSSGHWSPPRNMGATLNTNGFEISPFLSADKKRLYFASNGHGGQGDADIFYSERLYNSWETWSLPVNLGKVVNSEKFDAYFSIYGDSLAYFASNRDGKFADIYEVKVAPVKTVLAPGQHYLSADEWNRELGGAVSNELLFPGGSATLTPAQKELLFYIANKLQLNKGILFHLVVKEEEDPELSTTRVRAIMEHLVQSGIGQERIILEQPDSAQQADQGKIEIKLIE